MSLRVALVEENEKQKLLVLCFARSSCGRKEGKVVLPMAVCRLFLYQGLLCGGVLGQDDPYQMDHVLDAFCTELAHHPCNHPPRHICASDGRTYNNL
ncbi:hypothetical protein BaRGS_00038996 [Batillaria attramentaria]|uniref:Uncharacterized protein n=1 Tax=Batillaria attramentaria TaxID=370345 RepID=A0ABD0J4I3_9CAEN